jgi:caffeoyl-CoA O-methyltransferase
MLFAIEDKEIDRYIEKNMSNLPGDNLLDEIERFTFWNTVNPRMISGKIQARILQYFVMMTRAKKILEIGTFTGYSAVAMANVLPDDGVVVSLEVNEEYVYKTNTFLSGNSVMNKIKIFTADFDRVLKDYEEFDLIFVDGEKDEYLDYFEKYFPYLSSSGVMIFDNVLWSKKIFDKKAKDKKTVHLLTFNEAIKQNNEVINFILPVRDGLMIVMKNSFRV